VSATASVGLRSAVRNIAPMMSTTPIISMVTPATVILPMNATPAALMIVHSTMVMLPRMMPFVAPDTDNGSMSPPMIWKPLQIGGSTVCMAMANAAMLTM
jgi:hypothetical protein